MRTRGVPPAARVFIPPELKGTPDEVRLLRHGWQRADADSLARELLAEAEERYGPQSPEAADALDLLVWGVNFDAYDPLGTTRRMDELLPLASRALAIKEAKLDSNDVRLAASLDNMACLSGLQGDSAQARRYAERSLAICTAAYGAEHPKTAQRLRLLGHVRLHFGDASGAMELYEQALRIQEKTLDPFDLEIAETLYWMIPAHDSIEGDFRLSYPIWTRLFEMYRRSLGEHQYKTIICMMALAQVLPSMKPEEAEAFHLETVRTAEAALGPQHRVVERVYWQVVNYYCNWFRPIKGERFIETAIKKFPYGPVVLQWSGVFFYLVGDYARALDLTDQAVNAIEQQTGPSNWRLGRILANRGELYLATGSYEEARRDFERSRQIFEALPELVGDALAMYAWALVGLAEFRSKTGDYPEVESLYERAIEANIAANQGTGGWLAAEIGVFRLYFGQALLRMDKPARAVDQFRQADAILKQEQLVEEHPFQFEIVQGMAEGYLALGKRDTATMLFRECLAMRAEELGADHPSVATSLLGLSLVERQEGQLDSAKTHLERAASIAERAYGGAHPELAMSLEALAEVALAEGKPEEALAAALRSEEMSREHMRLTAQGLSERRALAFAGVRNSGLECALTAATAIDQPDAVRAAWDAVIRSRGMVLDEMAERHRLLERGEDPGADSLARELRRARTRLANLMVRGSGSEQLSVAAAKTWAEAPAEQRRVLYQEAQSEKEGLEEALAERSAVFRQEQRRAALGYDEVAAAIPAGSAVVSYWRYKPVSGMGEDPKRVGIEHYVAFVCRQGESEPTLVPIGEAVTIDRAVNEWREQVTRIGSSDLQYQAAAASLRRQIWDPVAAHLGDPESVFIVPDGSLHLVSFASLPSASGGYLIENGPTLHHLSAERDLMMDSDQAARGEGLLALGDPLFDGDPIAAVGSRDDMTATYRGMRSSCRDFQSAYFDSLPETAAEVREVCALWPGPESGRQALLGAEATEASFKAQAPGHRVVHVATHGFFLGGECRSALAGGRAIGGMSALTVVEPPVTEIGENPLLLSGLALAGANRREQARPEEEDGILTAEEIASLDLSGVEWAVLSACETGVGEVRSGEGVFGLRRAFQVAGARTLIMSLWEVEDEATRDWMKHLYKARLVDGLDTAESVRQANLRTLNERRAKGQSTHPFYWGAFVAAGDWR